MDLRTKALESLNKARQYVKTGGEKILADQLDEQHGVSPSPGATALASLALLAVSKDYETEIKKGVDWLCRQRCSAGWRKYPEGPYDEEISKVAKLVIKTAQSGFFSKLSLLSQVRQFSAIILSLGDHMVPGLKGPTKEEIIFPHILEDKVLIKLPQYGRPVIVAASLLSAERDQTGVEKGLKILYQSQNEDGSWAEDIIATSLAVLALLRHNGKHDAIVRAAQWLKRKQYKSGGWPAFDQLKTWAMGWMASILSEQGIKNEDYAFLKKVGRWLIKAQNQDGSYGTTPPYTHPDLDDTAVGLIGLKALGLSNEKSVQLLKRLQNSDGSWGTFPTFTGNPPHIESHHPVYIVSTDVTIHILEALWNNGSNRKDINIMKGLNWLLSEQSETGELPSMWYERSFYSTAQLLELLNKWYAPSWRNTHVNRRIYNARQKAYEFIISSQNIDGSWGKSSVETALSLAALLKSSVPIPKITVEKGIKYLIERQNEDGSFCPSFQGIYAKGWNYEEPIATALTGIRALERYLYYLN